jgi:hypothetical protein
MEDLPGQRNLGRGTMLPLLGLISTCKLAREPLFCSKCIEEMGLEPTATYIPLLWFFEAVTACPIHKTHLTRSVCQIREYRRAFGGPQLPWRCATCGGNIRRCMEPSLDEPSESELWCSSQISELLDATPQNLEKERFLQNVDILLERHHSMSFSSFTKSCSIAKGSAWGFLKQSWRVPMYFLLQISRTHGIGLVDLCIRDLTKIASEIVHLSPVQSTRKPKKICKPGQTAEALTKALNDEAAVTLKAVARRVGCDHRTLIAQEPQLCEMVKLRFADQTAERMLQKKQQALMQLHQLRQICTERGVLLTSRSVFLLTGDQWKFHSLKNAAGFGNIGVIELRQTLDAED